MIAGLRLSWDICRRIIHTLILNCPVSIACRDPDQAASIWICEASGHYPELTGCVSCPASILICEVSVFVSKYLDQWALLTVSENMSYKSVSGSLSYNISVSGSVSFKSWTCELSCLYLDLWVVYPASIWICELCIQTVSGSVSYISCLYLDQWAIYPACI